MTSNQYGSLTPIQQYNQLAFAVIPQPQPQPQPQPPHQQHPHPHSQPQVLPQQPHGHNQPHQPHQPTPTTPVPPPTYQQHPPILPPTTTSNGVAQQQNLNTTNASPNPNPNAAPLPPTPAAVANNNSIPTITTTTTSSSPSPPHPKRRRVGRPPKPQATTTTTTTRPYLPQSAPAAANLPPPPPPPPPSSNPQAHTPHPLNKGPYTTSEDAVFSLQLHVFTSGYGVSQKRTVKEKLPSGRYDPSGSVIRKDFACDRGGSEFVSQSTGERRRESKKCGCPWKAVVRRLKREGDMWFVEVLDARHNHPVTPPDRMHTIASYRRWQRENNAGIRGAIERLTRAAAMPARRVADYLKGQFADPDLDRIDKHILRALSMSDVELPSDAAGAGAAQSRTVFEVVGRRPTIILQDNGSGNSNGNGNGNGNGGAATDGGTVSTQVGGG